MKVKNGFILREIADSIVVVPTGELVKDFEGMIHLNSTGKFIWELLNVDITIEEIANKLVEQYKIDFDRAKKSAENFITKLREANLIEE